MTKRPGWALFTFVVESGDVVLAWTRTQSRPALVVPFKCMRETPLIISYYYNSSERECLIPNSKTESGSPAFGRFAAIFT